MTIPEVLQILSRVPGVEDVSHYRGPRSYRVQFVREGLTFNLFNGSQLRLLNPYDGGFFGETEILSAAETVRLVREALARHVPATIEDIGEEFFVELEGE